MPDHGQHCRRSRPSVPWRRRMGFQKGKSAIHIARVWGRTQTPECRPALPGAELLGADRGLR